ncbi:MAG: hypothetical protein NVS2B9_05740 [Myxococcales bacterium]
MVPGYTEPAWRWNKVAEDAFCPAVAARGERGLVLLFRSATGELCVRARDGMEWGPMRSLGVPTARVEGSGKLAPVDWPIAACGTGDDDVHLLARGAEGELLHGRLRGRGAGACFDGLGWSGFVSIGVPVPPDEAGQFPMGLAGAPAACSRARGQMDVFGVSGTGVLLHTSWDGARFSECEAVQGLGEKGRGLQAVPFPAAVAACAAGSRILGVLARGAAGNLWMTWWDGTRWSPFGPVHPPEEFDPLDPSLAYTFPLSGPPAVCGGGSARRESIRNRRVSPRRRRARPRPRSRDSRTNILARGRPAYPRPLWRRDDTRTSAIYGSPYARTR